MKDMRRLKDMLCKEVEEIQDKGELSAGDLETLHKLTDTIKNIDKIEMLEEEGGYSGDGDWEARGRFGHGRNYDDGASYANRGKHYVRGHYSRDGGRNYSRDDGRDYSMRGYSRDGGMEEIEDNLKDMMKSATGRTREALRRALEEIKAG